MARTRRLFLLVATVVLVDTMFYAAITPLLPHYTDELGLSKSAAGILSASYAAGTLLGSIPAGLLAMRLGVKRALLLGLALLSTSSLVFGFASDIVLLDLARFAQGIGGAFSWAGGLAWLATDAPRERRGELIGSAIAAAVVGILLGPVLGGAATATSPELVFSGVCVLGVVLAGWAVATPALSRAEPAPLRTLVAALRDPRVVAGFWLVALPALFSGVLNVLAPLRLDHLGASGVAVGAVFLVAAAVEAVISPFIGRLSDRRGRWVPIRVGLVGATAGALLLPVPARTLVLAAVIVTVVVVLAGFWTPAMALLSDAADACGLDQSFSFSLTNVAWAGGQVAGGAAGGRLADATADVVPYAILSALCAITLVMVSARMRGRSAVGEG